ncbi:uncharacterized protein LOC131881294 isoform X2 [Tigriopus californicus]|uniref:uncharacterized protein LOC131881294 isoform X2 n=1 Tax=Tigriopus californicus TaxID=6832 RepID=UPI0027DA08C6|nr:uncharacterized protein LOC131881294 isoform X2 [Tigriopus californicus]
MLQQNEGPTEDFHRPQEKCHVLQVIDTEFWFTRNTQRLVWAWLLIYLALSPVYCTPLYYSHRKRKAAKPKWINPCGINLKASQKLASHFSLSHHSEVTPLTQAELLENVILVAKNALRHSSVFKEDFVKKTFLVDNWWEHHDAWSDMRYQWLPTWSEIPKNLHERTSQAHLETLKIEKAIKDIHRYLQKMAVGLEQVVLDQTLYDGQFMEEFNEAEYKLKAVLCELQIAMMEMGLSVDESAPDDTLRSIMSPEIRDIEDRSYRDLRDWYIYRDYMNGLEYVLHSFHYLKGQRN